jgi:alkanesulfonate monooxygenase SsuD/methylene tetrahydromethanopterin reductase-like flavin-dependent oxidoreductase (luciferase family)
MAEIGVGLTPLQLDVGAAVRLAQRAEGLGYAQFGTAEGWTHDAFVVLAQIAVATSRIELGTGVVSVWSRTPAALAMAATGVQRASGRRFHLGLGASSPPLVEGLHGLRWERPLGRLRATILAVRSLVEGGTAPVGREGATAVPLGVAPEVPISIVLAGLAPKSVRMAGELADHWLPFLWPRPRVAEGRALLAEGEAAAGDGRRTRTTVALPVALGPDEATARTVAAGWLLAYLTQMGPLYPRMLREQGYGAEVRAFLRANAAGGGPVVPDAAERLVRDVTLIATYDGAADAVRAWLDAGADGVQLVLPPALPEHDLHAMLEAAAPAAQPLALHAV